MDTSDKHPLFARDSFTIGELYGAVLSIHDGAQARTFYEQYVEYTLVHAKDDRYRTPEGAAALVKGNIGWIFGEGDATHGHCYVGRSMRRRTPGFRSDDPHTRRGVGGRHTTTGMRLLLVLLTFVLTACIPPPPATAPSPAPATAMIMPSPSVTVAHACVYRDNGSLPDPSPGCTPGAVNPEVTQSNLGATICRSGYTATVRPPVSFTDPIKRERMQAYGISDQPESAVELDHLIPLELGGAPRDIANLWPEKWDGPAGARVKDQTENTLKALVCNGRLSLVEAQQRIATNWRTADR